MLYAQFFQKAAWPAGSERIIEAVGDRAMVILDDRFALVTNMGIAAQECRARGYVAYRLYRAESVTRAHTPVTALVEV